MAFGCGIELKKNSKNLSVSKYRSISKRKEKKSKTDKI